MPLPPLAPGGWLPGPIAGHGQGSGPQHVQQQWRPLPPALDPAQAPPSHPFPTVPMHQAGQPVEPPPFDPGMTHDLQIGQIFTNMRLTMKVPRDTIARRLATTAFTIDAFETGALASLPHWRETERIVRGYCEFLDLSPDAILRRLRGHYHASGLPMSLMAMTPAPASADPSARQQPQTGPPRVHAVSTTQRRAIASSPRRRRRRRTLLALTAPLLLLAGMLYTAQSAPGALYSVLARLPQAIGGPGRAVVDMMVLTMAPMREGLRWVDVDDPQLRKADKLHTRL